MRRNSIDAQKAVRLSLDPHAEEYDMNHERRGIALVLNHVHFESMSTRKGSVKDATDLTASLGKLGFDVRVYTDPTMKTISTILHSSKFIAPFYPARPVKAVPFRCVSSISVTDQTNGWDCAVRSAEITIFR